MSSTSTPSHKLWIEQCAAARRIREGFGLKKALDYLIGEKYFWFGSTAENDPRFAAELPAFVAEIRSIFSPQEIRAYLVDPKRIKYFTPRDPELRNRLRQLLQKKN